nr:STAS/SEC14 domain-containing protein [uncultured Carboxylicivirga sp.]
MISYAYIDGLLHVTPTKDIDYTDLANFLKDFSKLENLPDNVKILYDLRDAKVHLHLNEISKLSALAEQMTLNVKTIRTAFVVEDPMATAYTMLYTWMPKSDRLLREHFSTEDAAVEWLHKIEQPNEKK